MLDPHLTPLSRRILRLPASILVTYKVKAEHITVTGFIFGIFAVVALGYQAYGTALCLILINRLADGLDGAVARLTALSDSGGFLDIVLDFVFYAAVAFGFAWADSSTNALAACLLVVSFMATGSSFLAFAIMARQHGIEDPRYPHKSMYYMHGLVEGTETIIFFTLCCLLPAHFPVLAIIFAVLCFATALIRIVWGYQTLNTATENRTD